MYNVLSTFYMYCVLSVCGYLNLCVSYLLFMPKLHFERGIESVTRYCNFKP